MESEGNESQEDINVFSELLSLLPKDLIKELDIQTKESQFRAVKVNNPILSSLQDQDEKFLKFQKYQDKNRNSQTKEDKDIKLLYNSKGSNVRYNNLKVDNDLFKEKTDLCKNYPIYKNNIQNYENEEIKKINKNFLLNNDIISNKSNQGNFVEYDSRNFVKNKKGYRKSLSEKIFSKYHHLSLSNINFNYSSNRYSDNTSINYSIDNNRFIKNMNTQKKNDYINKNNLINKMDKMNQKMNPGSLKKMNDEITRTNNLNEEDIYKNQFYRYKTYNKNYINSEYNLYSNSINSIKNYDSQSLKIDDKQNDIKIKKINCRKNYIEKKDLSLINNYNFQKQYQNLNTDEKYVKINNQSNQLSQIIIIINKIGIDLFIKLLQTYKGSLFFQNLLPNNSLTNKETKFLTNLIGMNINNIINDCYGNYFLQKFFLLCNVEDRINIYKYIKHNFINIATDFYGSRALNCLISLQSTEEEKIIIKNYTKNNLKELCFNQNASHIIEKIISTFKEHERNDLNDFIVKNFTELATDANGSNIIRTLIKFLKNINLIKEIIFILENNLNVIAVNQYCYLIINEVIEKFGYDTCKNIIKSLTNKIVKFSILKYSSFIIIFILEYMFKNNFVIFIELLKIIFLVENNFKEMIKYKFSTYVITKSFELMNEINSNLDSYFNQYDIKNKQISNYSINDNKFSQTVENQKIENGLKNNQKEKMNNDYEQYLRLKDQIYDIFENYATSKEKQKILDLLRTKKQG